MFVRPHCGAAYRPLVCPTPLRCFLPTTGLFDPIAVLLTDQWPPSNRNPERDIEHHILLEAHANSPSIADRLSLKAVRQPATPRGTLSISV
ncbi:hypothetical protein DPMN_171264 [Dreissena polymorpha]|uniref:Uncharacterized protein n=1 Tax=Dreissena polymorpha TaxID=45954 RepID=A0A9D4IDL0_DREPO|nr:hypothetical protein DPMN_171264 [Dreissena polymorpha]